MGKVARQWWVATAVVLMAIGLLAAACSKGADSSGSDSSGGGRTDGVSTGTAPQYIKKPSGPPKSGGKLVYGLEAETDGWDPSQNRWAVAGTQVAFAVFDPLMSLDKEFNPKPVLAESFTATDGFATWNMTLRKGIKFHNGQDFDAAAVKKALDSVKSGLLTGAAMKPIQSIDVTGDHSLRFTIDGPWATLPAMLTAQVGVIPAPEQLDNKETAPFKPIGTGPFVFKEWVRDAKFVATKNPSYWRPGLPYLDEIEFRPIPDVTTRMNALQGGDIDLMTTSSDGPTKTLETAAKKGEIQLTRSTGNNDLIFLLMNTSTRPLDDVRVRKAMAHAMDRKTIADIGGIDPSQIADSVFQPDSFWHTAQSDYPNHDPVRAKQLVEEYTREKGPIELRFGTAPDNDTLRPAQVIAEQLSQVGIEANITTTDQATLITNAVTGNFQVMMWRQFGALDPDGNFIFWSSQNAEGPVALNMARFKDPVIDEAMKDGRSTIDPAERKQAYDRLQAEQTAALPYLWINHTRWVLGADNRLRGLDGSELPDGGVTPGLVAGLLGVGTLWFDT